MPVNTPLDPMKKKTGSEQKQPQKNPQRTEQKQQGAQHRSKQNENRDY